MQKQYLDLLKEFISFKSISADSKYKNELLKSASWLLDQCKTLKAKTKLIRTPGNPIVYANWKVNDNLPTILIYGHYDVQPAEPVNEWSYQPFILKLTKERGGKHYTKALGRGVSDNKGQIIIWLLAIKKLLKNKQLGFNIKLIIEGEEEIGSPNINRVLNNHPQLFKADVALILDETMPIADQPAIHTSLRGIIYQQIELRAHTIDLHSGTYGGKAINPAIKLMSILTKVKDPNNKIVIPKFYQNVIKQTYSASSIDELDFHINESGFSSEESATVRPTFEVNGFWSGYTGKGAKTIIPAIASAKISCRLVANQNPKQISALVKSWLKDQQKEGFTISVKDLDAEASPVYSDPKNIYLKNFSKSLKKIFKQKPLLLKSGGSIGAAADIQNKYKIPLILTGFVLNDCKMHAPDENIYLPTILKGIDVLVDFLKNK